MLAYYMYSSIKHYNTRAHCGSKTSLHFTVITFSCGYFLHSILFLFFIPLIRCKSLEFIFCSPITLCGARVFELTFLERIGYFTKYEACCYLL